MTPQQQTNLIKYIPLTKGKFAIIDVDDYDYLSQWKWRVTTLGYAVRTISKTTNVVWMHREINKTPTGYETDHINQDKLDNRKVNLRTVTHSQNNRNRLNKRNTSGHKGVGWDKDLLKWRVQIYAGKHIYIGVYKNFDDAVKAYKKAARKYHGEYAGF